MLELLNKDRINHLQYTDLLGLFRVRYAGFLTKLSKLGFEKTEYTSADEVVSLLLQAVLKAISVHGNHNGQKVTIPPKLAYAMHFVEKEQALSSSQMRGQRSKVVEEVTALTPQEAKSPEYKAKMLGFRVGGHVSMKRNDPSTFVSGVFKIDVINSSVELKEVNVFKDKAKRLFMKVELLMFFKQFTVFNGQLPLQLDGSWELPHTRTIVDH